MPTQFRADRLRADLAARKMGPLDLVRLLVAHEHGDLDFTYRHLPYMKHKRRVERFLAGQSSLETACAIADAMGYAPSRYVTLRVTHGKDR